jgi:uncharacterized membrane protein YdjX (TVP38/TMEM64 family)
MLPRKTICYGDAMMPRTARAALILGLALCVPLVPFFLVGELPGEHWLSARDGHALHFALAGLALLAADALLPVPSSIVGTMLGARLGWSAGFVTAFAGLMLGQAALYLAGRRLLRRAGDTLPAAPTLAVVVISRPVPVLAEAVAMAAGAARVSVLQFLAACAAGNAVYAGALAINGAQLLPGQPLGLGLLLPLLLPVAGWTIWRALRRAPS